MHTILSVPPNSIQNVDRKSHRVKKNRKGRSVEICDKVCQDTFWKKNEIKVYIYM